MNGTKLTGIIGHVNKELNSVELARIEFEKNLEDDPNNEWLKRLIIGLKMAEQSLRRLAAIENVKPREALECLEKLESKSQIMQGCYEFNISKKEESENNEEVDKYANTIKQVLLKLDFLEDAMDLPTNCFSTFKNRNNDEVTVMRKEIYEEYCIKENALKELFENHIELIVEEDRCYFKIKNSKGKEKSFTSYTMIDFWKEVLKKANKL